MDTDAVVIRDLTKLYKDFTLDKVSFRIPRGTIMGFVGENGAGKTTTIKAMLDLINTDGGEIYLLGCPSKRLTKEVKSELGVVFDGSNSHDTLTIENISLIMKNIYSNWDETMFQGYISRFNLPKSKIIKEFSRGMKMKLSIAAALSHHPKLLILDEATSGLDPLVRDIRRDIP